MANLSVDIAGVSFKNPVIAASGTFGNGREFSEFFPLSKLGGISCKGTTLEPREGNPPPRIAETPSGVLNSVGLQNMGVRTFCAGDLKWLKSQDVVVIANVAGSTVSDYCETAGIMCENGADIIELNISCPNVKEGGASFGSSCSSVEEITREVKKVCTKPLMVKLSPNVTDIAEIAVAAEYAGADAISLINTITGLKIDINTKRPLLKNNTGGLSGPAVLPIAVRMVWQAANRVSIPVVGMGGISKWQDAVEMMLAGASAVQVGTANFSDPYVTVKIADGINSYLEKNGIQDVNDIVGRVEIW